jgi:hypothetical protein
MTPSQTYRLVQERARDMLDEVETEGPEIGWTTYADTLIRWQRFIAVGLVVSFAMLALWAWLGPRAMECEATLALPNAEPPPTPGPGPTPGPTPTISPGVTLATYKEVERTLSDSAVLSAALSTRLSEVEVRRFQRNLGSHLLVVTTNPRDEFARISREDSITAVRLSYTDRGAERAEAVVVALADVVRKALCTRTAQRAVETSLLKSIATADAVQSSRALLTFTNDSLKLQEADLGKVAAAGGSGAREVVDVAEGGYRYLPPAVQLVGVQALRVENEHKVRMAEMRLAVERLNEGFLRGFKAKIDAECDRNHLLADAPGMLDAEINAVFANRKEPEAVFVRDQLRSVQERWRHQAENVRYIQYPTTRPASRAFMLVASAAAIVLFFLLAPFVAESWRSGHTVGR